MQEPPPLLSCIILPRHHEITKWEAHCRQLFCPSSGACSFPLSILPASSLLPSVSHEQDTQYAVDGRYGYEYLIEHADYTVEERGTRPPSYKPV